MIRGPKIVVDDMVVCMSCSVKGLGKAKWMEVNVVETVDGFSFLQRATKVRLVLYCSQIQRPVIALILRRILFFPSR